MCACFFFCLFVCASSINIRGMFSCKISCKLFCYIECLHKSRRSYLLMFVILCTKWNRYSEAHRFNEPFHLHHVPIIRLQQLLQKDVHYQHPTTAACTQSLVRIQQMLSHTHERLDTFITNYTAILLTFLKNCPVHHHLSEG